MNGIRKPLVPNILKNVAVLIPIKDCWDLTKVCINSMLINNELPALVLLVNDHSNEIQEINSTGILTVKRIDVTEGTGFGSAINSGMFHILEYYPEIEYVILLNNDTIIQSVSWISTFRQHFEQAENVGLVGLGSVQCEFTKEIPVILGKYDYLGFWAVMVGCEVWKDVGLLDKRFEMGYHEDRDWCYRAQDKGYELVKEHNINIFHTNNATFDTHNIDKLYYGKINHDKFIDKWGFLE